MQVKKNMKKKKKIQNLKLKNIYIYFFQPAV